MGKIFCTRCGYDITEASRLIDVSKALQPITGEHGVRYRIYLELGAQLFGETLNVVSKEELSANSAAAFRKFKTVTIDWEGYAAFFQNETGISLLEYETILKGEPEKSDAEKSAFLNRLAEVLYIPGSFTRAYDLMGQAEGWLKRLKRRLSVAGSLRACWVKRTYNGKIMPYRLAVLDAESGNIVYPSKCCCPHCKKEIPSWLGAFDQRIIGIVGGQNAGKTSYITALADIIKDGSILKDKKSGNHGNLCIETSFGGEDDLGWLKEIHMPGNPDVDTGEPSDEKSPYWYYRSGYSVPKTEVRQEAISVISFLVKPGQGASRKSMLQYVLVDIPGEAFADPFNFYKIKEDFFQRYGSIIYQCTGLLVMISADHLEGKANLNLDYHRVLYNAKELFGNRQENLSIGLIVSKFDQLDDSKNFESTLKLSFDLQKAAMYAVDIVRDEQGKDKTLDYFAVETMNLISRRVAAYVERKAPGIMGRLLDMYPEEGNKKVAFFPVAAYGKAVDTYTSDDDCKRQERSDAYQKIAEARFFVEVPLLWMLACDGMLICGRRWMEEDYFLNQVQKEQIDRALEDKLYWQDNI